MWCTKMFLILQHVRRVKLLSYANIRSYVCEHIKITHGILHYIHIHMFVIVLCNHTYDIGIVHTATGSHSA